MYIEEKSEVVLNTPLSYANIIKWLLIALLVPLSMLSTISFLVFRQIPVHIWFFLNPCAPTSFYTAIILILDQNKYSGKSLIAMNIAVPLLLFFGVDGLLSFSWVLLFAQLQHIIMAFTGIFILLVTYYSNDEKKFLKLGLGLLLGISILLILYIVVYPIVLANPLAQQIMESYTP